MLPGGSDPFYRRLLATPHRHFVRVEIWSRTMGQLTSLLPSQDVGDNGGMVFTSGALSATLDSRVTRSVRLTVPPDLYPMQPGDLLDPFAHELRAYRGVALADGTETYVWQCFRGRVTSVSKTSDGGCDVTCMDRAQEVVDFDFVSPQNAQTINTVFGEWQRVLVDALPDASFGSSDTFTEPVQPLTWEFGRGSALDELATSVGAVWFALANGDFVLRRFPWSVTATPVVSVSDANGGSVQRWQRSRSRLSIFNVVTVTGERLNGDAPVFATAQDATPGSPTSVLGDFGRRSLLKRLQTPSTQGGALSAAEALLRTYVAPTEEWTLEMTPDAALELGDALLLQLDGGEHVQVVSGFTLPLDLSGNMTVSTRSLVVGGVS